ncbi:MAG: formylglycine-generating enzyme family protein [Lewinellaceae bacterium]|nr:formylglycine-generating enzyme family protein [Lewinellaceae bacterium]
MSKEHFSQALANLDQPFDMIYVEGGEFDMGDEYGDLPGYCWPVHKVKVPDFYIGKHPVTQALWKSVMDGENPSEFKGDNRPVERVSWDEVQGFLARLNELTGYFYRLPAEAEWEYAARGGKYHAEGYKYAGSDRLKDVGWFDKNSGNETHPVGQKRPNQLDIFDMNGNVFEWCEDDWHNNYNDAPNDGSAWIDHPDRGLRRVHRGGSWTYAVLFCRVAIRNYNAPINENNNIGFRLALSPQ